MLDRNLAAFFIALGIIVLAGFLIYYTQPRINEKIPFYPPERKESPPLVKQNEQTPNGLFTVAANPSLPIQIGILGSLSKESERQGFDVRVLKRFLSALEARAVQAIFLTGSMVSGKQRNGKFSLTTYKKQLRYFSHIVKKTFKSSQIPIFPVITKEDVSSGRYQEILNQLHLENALLLKSGIIVYGVNIGAAFFALISETFALDNISSETPPEGISWLANALAKEHDTHPYLFVIGLKPFFPISPLMLNQTSPKNDLFWNTLIQNHTLAYFASQENLFDRSNHNGVWQIISGGSNSEGEKGEPFYHCLLLTIPPEGKNAKIQVLDEYGNAFDAFDLQFQKAPLLYQLHIK